MVLFTPIEKVRTSVFWLAPFAFLSAFSPLGSLLIPIAAERLLSASQTHWEHGGHYSAPLAPLLAMAAGDTLARLVSRAPTSSRRAMLVNALLGVSLITSIFLPGHQPLLRVFTARHYAPLATQSAAAQALALIEPGASVVAQTPVLPHLSQRQEIHLLWPTAPDADFVVAAPDLDPWPNASGDEIRALLDERRRRGYVVLFESDGWIVLARR